MSTQKPTEIYSSYPQFDNICSKAKIDSIHMAKLLQKQVAK